MRITLVYFEGCPNWRTADERLRALCEQHGFTLDRRQLRTHEEAEQLGFRGSPTILVDGRDPFARGDEPVGLSCRVYETEEGFRGVPSVAELEELLSDRGDLRA